jgi:hypothetical protein
LKEYAVNVLSAAFKHKKVASKYSEKSAKVLAAKRKFRGNTL